MSETDRNFVLELLAREANVQQERATFYGKGSSPLRVVAGSRAFTLALLTGAIERGLMEQLAEEAARDGADDDYHPAEVDQYYDPTQAAAEQDTGRDYDVTPGGEL